MNHAVTVLNAFAASWMAAFVHASWQGGMVIALLWLLCRLWPSLPPGLRGWLWRMAYVKLLLGLVCLPPFLLPVLPNPPVVTKTAPTPGPSPASGRGEQEKRGPGGAPLAAPSALVTPSFPTPSDSPLPLAGEGPGVGAARALPSVQTYLLAAWILGLFAGLIRIVRAWQRASRLYHTGKPLRDDALLTEMTDLCRRFGLRRAPALRVTEEILSPILLGLTRPAILMPAFVLADCPPAELRLMLAHETAHLKRRDLIWSSLPALARLLFFFHPLVWLAEHEWLLAQEIACDALAVQVTETPLSAYGRMLLRVAVRRPAPKASLFPTLAVAAPRRTLHRRLFAMQHIGTASRPQIIASAALFAALILGGLLPWRVVAQSKPSATASPAASQTEAMRQKFSQKEQADIAAKNALLDAQIADIQQHLSPAQLKTVQPEIAKMNAQYAEEEQRTQLLEQQRDTYSAAHPNHLSDAQIASVRHFNWFQWKPYRIRRNIHQDQILKRKLQAALASASDAHSGQNLHQQIAAIEQRRRQGETQIRDWQPIIDRERAQLALLPSEQRARVEKLDRYNIIIEVNRQVDVIIKQVWVQGLRRRLADKLSVEQQTTNKASIVPLDASAAFILTPQLSLFPRHGTLRVRIYAQDATGRYLVLDKRSYGKNLIVPSVKAKKGVKINLLVYDNERVRDNWWF